MESGKRAPHLFPGAKATRSHLTGLRMGAALLGLVAFTSSADAASVFIKLDGVVSFFQETVISDPIGRFFGTGYSQSTTKTPLADKDTPFTAYARYDTDYLKPQFGYRGYDDTIGLEVFIPTFGFNSTRPTPVAGIPDAQQFGKYSSYSLNQVQQTTYLSAQAGWRSSQLHAADLVSYDIPQSSATGAFKAMAAAVAAKFPDIKGSGAFEYRFAQVGLNGTNAMSMITSGTGSLEGSGIGFLNMNTMSNFGLPSNYAGDVGAPLSAPMFMSHQLQFSGFLNSAFITEDPTKITSVSFVFEQMNSGTSPMAGIPITDNNLGVSSSRFQLSAIPIGTSTLGQRVLTWEEAAAFYQVDHFNWTQQFVSHSALIDNPDGSSGFSRINIHDLAACESASPFGDDALCSPLLDRNGKWWIKPGAIDPQIAGTDRNADLAPFYWDEQAGLDPTFSWQSHPLDFDDQPRSGLFGTQMEFLLAFHGVRNGQRIDLALPQKTMFHWQWNQLVPGDGAGFQRLPDGSPAQGTAAILGLYAQTDLPARLSAILSPTTAPVPEPTTWIMMMVGMGIVGGAIRRRPKVTSVA